MTACAETAETIAGDEEDSSDRVAADQIDILIGLPADRQVT